MLCWRRRSEVRARFLACAELATLDESLQLRK